MRNTVFVIGALFRCVVVSNCLFAAIHDVHLAKAKNGYEEYLVKVRDFANSGKFEERKQKYMVCY